MANYKQEVTRISAIRRARSTTTSLSMHSPAYASLVACRKRLQEFRRKASDVLCCDIHVLVQTAQSREERHRLIQLKRAVYNSRVRPDLLVGMSKTLTELIQCLWRAVKYEESLGSLRMQRRVLRDLEGYARDLSNDRLFALAIHYSAPQLHVSLMRLRSSNEAIDVKDLVSLYSYALKHFSKAPALSTFARILSEYDYPSDGGEIAEINVNPQWLKLCEEDNLVQNELDKRLILNISWEHHGRVFFLATSGVRVHLSALQNTTPFWKPLRARFNEARTLSLPREEIENLLIPYSLSDPSLTVDTLVKRGILRPVLFEDPWNPSEDELSLIPHLAESSRSELAGPLRRRVPTATLPEATQRLGAALGELGHDVAPPFMTYAYATSEAWPALSSGLSSDLQDLYPLFGAIPNSQHLHQRLTNLVSSACEACQRRYVPFTQVLVAALRFLNTGNGVQGSQLPTELEPALQCLAARSGNLTRSELATIAEAVHASKTSQPRHLLLASVLSRSGDVLYPFNILCGYKRYVSPPDSTIQQSSEDREDGANALVVEIIPDAFAPHHLLTPTTTIGFVTDSRLAHRFGSTLSVADVEMKICEDRRQYRLTSTGTPLQFIYRGRALIDHLALPYQLMLEGHADFCNNLALNGIPPLAPPFQWQPELRYNRVVLRRQALYITRSSLLPLMQATWTGGSFLLADLIQEHYPSQQQFYYRLVAGATFLTRPRFLDLLTPLSWLLLRRDLQRYDQAAFVQLTECSPALNQMESGGASGGFGEVFVALTRL